MSRIKCFDVFHQPDDKIWCLYLKFLGLLLRKVCLQSKLAGWEMLGCGTWAKTVIYGLVKPSTSPDPLPGHLSWRHHHKGSGPVPAPSATPSTVRSALHNHLLLVINGEESCALAYFQSPRLTILNWLSEITRYFQLGQCDKIPQWLGTWAPTLGLFVRLTHLGHF